LAFGASDSAIPFSTASRTSSAASARYCFITSVLPVVEVMVKRRLVLLTEYWMSGMPSGQASAKRERATHS
jgi:hypothetical protein